MNQLEGYTSDPSRLAIARSLPADLLGVTPADLQALAARYLVPQTSWSAIVLARGLPVPFITKQQTAGNAIAPPPPAASQQPASR